MAFLKYLTKVASGLPEKHHCKSTSLTIMQLKVVNEGVKRCMKDANVNGTELTAKQGKYSDYTPEQHAHFSKYAAENGPTRAVKHFQSQNQTRGDRKARTFSRYVRVPPFLCRNDAMRRIIRGVSARGLTHPHASYIMLYELCIG